MKRSRFTEEQIIDVLKEYAAGTKVDELCRHYGISTVAYYLEKHIICRVPRSYFADGDGIT